MHLNVPVALLVAGCLVLGTWGLALLAWRGVSAVRGSTFPGRAVLPWLAVLFAFVCAVVHLWTPSCGQLALRVPDCVFLASWNRVLPVITRMARWQLLN